MPFKLELSFGFSYPAGSVSTVRPCANKPTDTFKAHS